MKVFDYLRQLHAYFLDLHGKGEDLFALYQRVQGANLIIPRLYLMITVGSAIILSGEAPVQDVLQDLIEMSKGVQHPMRGLFLRNYLLKMTQDKLGRVGSEFCVSYILQNLGEMNRLWVRMQHQGTNKNKARREKERQELKVLVSFNLVRLSEIEGMSAGLYRAALVDQVLDLVTNCKDRIAQQFLLDVLINVFPSQYHLATLDKLFSCFEHLEAGVDLKGILVGLMERIKQDQVSEGEEREEPQQGQQGAEPGSSPSPSSSPPPPPKVKGRVPPEAFGAIGECVAKLVAKNAMSAEEVLDLYVALLDLAVSCYPGDLGRIDEIMGLCARYLEGAHEAGPQTDVIVVQLLKVPLRQKELATADLLGLQHFPQLMARLAWASKKKVAHGFLAHCLADQALRLDDADKVGKLLAFIAPLVRDDAAQDAAEEQLSAADQTVFEEQQVSVAKLVHRVDHDEPAELFKLLNLVRKHFGHGGLRRIRFTLVPLAFRYLQLVDRTAAMQQQQQQQQEQQQETVTVRKVFQYVHEIASALAGVLAYQETALRLFLEAALGADRAREQEVAYEFFAQAFTLYEDIADSKEQLRTLPLLIGTVQRTTVFDKESYETLATKTAQYAARLLRKTDQCKMVVLCSHLFWAAEPERALREGEQPPAPGQDAKRALECLQRSLKIADNCMASALHAALFIEVLNRYAYFLQRGMDKVTAQNVADLVQLIKSNLLEMQPAATEQDREERQAAEAFLNNTAAHLALLKQRNAGDARFKALT
jgi:vacuolar protein sorting-associated protein 35